MFTSSHPRFGKRKVELVRVPRWLRPLFSIQGHMEEFSFFKSNITPSKTSSLMSIN